MVKGRFSLKLSRLLLLFMIVTVGHVVGQTAAIAQSSTDTDFQAPPSSLPALPSLPPVTDDSLLGDTSLVGDTYILGVGDTLRVDVFNIPDYTGEFRVLPGGSINIPVVGDIVVEGMSVRQATDHIEQQLAAYVRRPNVTLSVIGTRPMQIAIAGEVRRPGAYQVSNGGGAAELPTLTQAIELAEGITQLADIRNIEVKRRLPSGATTIQPNTSLISSINKSKDGFQTIPINLWELLKEGDLSKDVQLQDGDRVIIPTANALSADEVTELATASFSPDQILINVVGEVNTPGNVRVPPNTPLNQAILAAGGFNSRARKGKVNLVRLNLNGTATEREIEVDFGNGVNEDTNPALRPNDTIIVQTSGLSRANDTFRGILAPLNFGIRLLNLF
ncbi:MAG: polysaccharide export protein [Leptolyngbya sp. SIO3F4]|nr:polysaccharide export protein [Leptolyngbya sp. SIO3F4]